MFIWWIMVELRVILKKKHYFIRWSSTVLCSVHSQVGKHHPCTSTLHLGYHLRQEVLNTPQDTFLVSQRKKKSLSGCTTPIPNITYIHTHVHTSHPSKCHRLGRTLRRCQRFRGPGINITSFLSIRAYLFPSSYCTSVSDPICIPGKSPDESRALEERKTEWDKDKGREEDREWERNEGRGSLGKASEEGGESEQVHLRFTEGMKYDGVLPWVITDESGYKTAHCPKWLICPAVWRYKSLLSY